MAQSSRAKPTEIINLVYIRAAIEANTGIRLGLKEIRNLLVEEGLITAYQAKTRAPIFKGYGDFYDADDYTVRHVSVTSMDDV